MNMELRTDLPTAVAVAADSRPDEWWMQWPKADRRDLYKIYYVASVLRASMPSIALYLDWPDSVERWTAEFVGSLDRWKFSCWTEWKTVDERTIDETSWLSLRKDWNEGYDYDYCYCYWILQWARHFSRRTLASYRNHRHGEHHKQRRTHEYHWENVDDRSSRLLQLDLNMHQYANISERIHLDVSDS